MTNKAKSPFKASGDTFAELSLEEVQNALSSQKRSLTPTVAFATLLEWKDGIPVVVGIPVRMSQSPAEKIIEALTTALDLPYQGDDPSLQGLTMGWAMVVQEARKASQGDSEALGRIMNRIVGAPVQKTQSLNLNGNLSDFLDKVAVQTTEMTIDVKAEVKPDMSDL